MPGLSADSLLHLAVRKGDSRLQQSPQGPLCSEMLLPLLLAASLIWQGPNWQAQQLRSPGGAGEGRVRGRQIPLQAQALGAWPMTGLPAGWLLPTTPLWLTYPPPWTPVLPQRGILETLHHPPQPRERRAEEEQQLAKQESQSQRNQRDPARQLVGALDIPGGHPRTSWTSLKI